MKPPQNAPPAPTVSARRLAVDILCRVDRGAFAEVLLDKALSETTIRDARDRRLATELVYGTLRMRGCLDGILDRHFSGGLDRLDLATRNILRTALYQHRYADRIPPFALVSEAVELAKVLSPRRAPLVNALLRNVLREKASDDDGPQETRLLPERLSHPAWLLERWAAAWGNEETVALCRANNQPAPLCLRTNTLKTERDALAEALHGEGLTVRKTQWSPDGLYVETGGHSLRETASYRRGWFQVQDEASQLVSHLAAPRPGFSVLDLCAGIGGKTTHLAALMGGKGRLVAVDLQKRKTDQIRQLARRLGATGIECRTADARQFLGAEYREAFETVLLDAPCSGLGTLRRAPEIKWRLHPEDLAGISALQRALLERAAVYVAPGGRLVYATCSIMPEENEDILEVFLSKTPRFRRQDLSDLFPGLGAMEGTFRTWPHRHGMDGFFVAVLVSAAGGEEKKR